MKRIALKKSSKPLKRSYKGLKRSAAKPMRKKRIAFVGRASKPWRDRYKAMIEHDKWIGWVKCAETGRTVRVETREPHHVNRRRGQNILIYCYITKGRHEDIEHNSKRARVEGWLQNPGQGYPKDPDQPRPWFPGSCMNEELLDEEI